MEAKAYKLLSRRAAASRGVVEHWKLDHDRAELVCALEEAYQDAFRSYEAFLRVDNRMEMAAAKENWSAEAYRGHEIGRQTCLMTLVSFYRALLDVCQSFDAESYQDAVCDLGKLRELISACDNLLNVDDESYLDRPEVQEAIRRSEEEIASGQELEYLPLP